MSNYRLKTSAQVHPWFTVLMFPAMNVHRAASPSSHPERGFYLLPTRLLPVNIPRAPTLSWTTFQNFSRTLRTLDKDLCFRALHFQTSDSNSVQTWFQRAGVQEESDGPWERMNTVNEMMSHTDTCWSYVTSTATENKLAVMSHLYNLTASLQTTKFQDFFKTFTDFD